MEDACAWAGRSCNLQGVRQENRRILLVHLDRGAFPDCDHFGNILRGLPEKILIWAAGFLVMSFCHLKFVPLVKR